MTIRPLQDHTALRAREVGALDACRDRTADVVAGFPEVTTVACAARRVGTARRAAASAALAECPDPEQLWLASTDADCRVPPDWLIEMAKVAARGAALALGTVRPAAGLPPGMARTNRQAGTNRLPGAARPRPFSAGRGPPPAARRRPSCRACCTPTRRVPRPPPQAATSRRS